jgi:hypothetical protein
VPMCKFEVLQGHATLSLLQGCWLSRSRVPADTLGWDACPASRAM